LNRLRYPLSLLIACSWLGGCAGRAGGPANPIPAVAPPAQRAQGSAEIELPEPPLVKAVNGVASVSLIVNENSATGQPEFQYRGMPNVAPTIEVKPGDTIVVDLKNDLPSEPPPAASGSLQQDMNLHFHGLGVSPQKPGDDVLTVLALPGQKLHYVVHIPKSQVPGLYWYHPHVHGETSFQVGASGMSGAIVIDGLTRHLPQLAKMKQRLIIVRATGTGGDDASGMAMSDGDMSDAAETTDSSRVQPRFTNAHPCTTKDGLTVTLNGIRHPEITIAPGEKQLFRVLNATGHKTLRLNVQGEKVEVVAIDGFPLDTYPGTPPTLTESSVVIPPASRADFVVTGPSSGRAKFRTLCYNTGPNGDPDPNIWLGDLVAPKRSSGAGDFSNGPVTVGEALPANAYTTALPPVAAKRLVVLSENSKPRFFINGKSFNPNSLPMFVVHTGTVEEWHIFNDTYEIHDFHIHQIHFLVISINGVKVQHPHWADSFIVPHRIGIGKGSIPGSIVALMDFRDPVIHGEFLFHCHILDHEDQGMMAKIEAI
jgi:suppressor of ftsI